MSRPRVLAVGAGAIVVAGLVVALVVRSGDASSTTSRPRRSVTLQPVRVRTLETTDDVDGTVGFGTPVAVQISASSSSSSNSSSSAGAAKTDSTGASTAATSSSSSGSGIITALPAVGTVVAPGQSLVEIDGTPSVFVMVGTRPMWRTLTAGVTDGPDVLQLEQSLTQLGFRGSMTVDETFSSATTSAIEAWQAANGLDQTGSLGPSDIVFLSGPVRVASQVASLGASATGTILDVTGTTPLVSVDLDASKINEVKAGDSLSIDLPDGSSVKGVVFAIGSPTSSSSSAAQGNQSQTTTTVPVTIVVPDADLSKFDGGTTIVHLVSARAESVLSVPVKSLLALAEGGYAVERVRGGVHQLVSVTPGTYAGGFVEVKGNVRDGDRVVTP